MLIRDREGAQFELRIIGYEFPMGNFGIEDDNWLVVKIKVSTPNGSWEATDPSLQTWDVARLANWLNDIADSKLIMYPQLPAPLKQLRGKAYLLTLLADELSFTEPDLHFKLMHNFRREIVIRVYFELELRPPWVRSSWAGLNDVYVDLAVTPEYLREAASALRRDLALYPQRADFTDYVYPWISRLQAQRGKFSSVRWQRLHICLLNHA